MKELFELLLSVTLSTNVFIVAILLIRFLFKRSSKNARLFLWLLVGIKLLLPFNLESKFSLIPRAVAETTSEIGSVATNVVLERTEAVQSAVNMETLFYIVWALGAFVILVYGAVSFWRLRKNIGDAIKMKDNVFQSEKVVSPFVLGVIKPKIYIPFKLDDETLSHIVSHEKSHLKSFDNITKLAAFVLLAVHWYNPLVWVCFKLLTTDIELACDERVVKNYTLEKRKSYAEALLSCAVNEGKGLIYPVAFGEVSVKDRIKAVVAYKKAIRTIVVLSILLSVAAFVCFATVPKAAAENREEKVPVVEATTEAYVEETTTEPMTEVTTEAVTEQPAEEYNENYETQPEFNLDDIDPEYREIFSIAQEEGKHVIEVMPQQEIDVDFPTKSNQTTDFYDYIYNNPINNYGNNNSRDRNLLSDPTGEKRKDPTDILPTLPVNCWDPSISDIRENGGKIQ